MTIRHDNLDDFESEIDSVLGGLAPSLAFEDRLIDQLRRSTSRFRLPMPSVHPFVLRSAIGVAATLAVAAIGYLGMSALERQDVSVAVNGTLRQPLREIGGVADESRSEPTLTPSLGRAATTDQGATAFRRVQRDNVSTARGRQDTFWNASPRDANDSFLLPDEDDKSTPSAGKAAVAQAANERFAAGAMVIEGKPQVNFETATLGYALADTLSPALPAFADGSGTSSTTAQTPSAPEGLKQTTMLGVELRAANEPTATTPVATITDTRKIIRTGTVEFEVASFDASFVTLTKIVEEEAGLIGSTESTKLENGKTRGTVVVRVPPEHLDRLVMKLRGLGELKTQNISAADVTKQYTDLESQLRAASAMQDRLLEIIKTGNGAIKDLLAAEKELGNWRTKIEQLEGERRFIDSQVSLSTLSITLTEKDIAQAATLTQTETVNAGIECDDVEKSRAAVLATIDNLGGRVMSADLKQLDAGQFSSTILAEVKPDASGQLIDRLKQLGRVARLTAERTEKASDGSASPSAPKIETKPSVFQISLYNLANIAPRTTQTITLASNDVEAAYRGIIEEAGKLAGRVVASEMNHPRPDSVTASLRIDVPSTQAEALFAKLKSLGVVVSSTDAQSPDNTNTTSSKRGFSLTLIDTASVPPRENVNASVRVDSAGNALATLLANVQQTGGKVISQSHTRDASGSDSASVSIDVPGSASPTILQALQSLGKVESIQSNQNPNVPAGELARARYDVQLATADAIAPRDGFWNSVRNGLAISFRGLGYSLQLIIVGFCLVAPWALLVWLGVKLRRRMRSTPAPLAQ